MVEIKSFIKANMKDYSREKIDEYVWSFVRDNEITTDQYDKLMSWVDKWIEVR